MGSAARCPDVVAEGIHVDDAGFGRLHGTFDDDGRRLAVSTACQNLGFIVDIGNLFKNTVFFFIDVSDVFFDAAVEAIMGMMKVFRVADIIQSQIQAFGKIGSLTDVIVDSGKVKNGRFFEDFRIRSEFDSGSGLFKRTFSNDMKSRGNSLAAVSEFDKMNFSFTIDGYSDIGRQSVDGFDADTVKTA